MANKEDIQPLSSVDASWRGFLPACLECKKQFKRKRKDQRFCSPEHKKLLYQKAYELGVKKLTERSCRMSERIFTESLKCILTDEEKQNLGTVMAEAVARINEAEAELKSFQTQIKSRIAADESTMVTCSEKIRTGYEFRRVECREEKDYDNEKVRYIRLDTYDTYRIRDMEASERQKDLPLEKEETAGDNGGSQPVEIMQEV
jgi:hypothetical protein